MKAVKEVIWVGCALKDLKRFPIEVMDEMGYTLHLIQAGQTPRNTKSLTGLGAGVREIISNVDSDTYRAVYTANINDTIYVLHCFQKKSKRGISTPKQEIALIKQRLQQAKRISQRKLS